MRKFLEYIDQKFSAMMTRPGMYVGNMPDHSFELEILCVQMLEFRFLFLGIPQSNQIHNFYHHLCNKHFKVGSLWGFNSTVKSEEDFVQKMRLLWEEMIAWQDKLAVEDPTILQEKEDRFCVKCQSLVGFHEQGPCCCCGNNPWDTEVLFPEDIPESWIPVSVEIRKKRGK